MRGPGCCTGAATTIARTKRIALRARHSRCLTPRRPVTPAGTSCCGSSGMRRRSHCCARRTTTKGETASGRCAPRPASPWCTPLRIAMRTRASGCHALAQRTSSTTSSLVRWPPSNRSAVDDVEDGRGGGERGEQEVRILEHRFRRALILRVPEREEEEAHDPERDERGAVEEAVRSEERDGARVERVHHVRGDGGGGEYEHDRADDGDAIAGEGGARLRGGAGALGPGELVGALAEAEE